MDSIHGICVVNNDAIYYQSPNPEKCLETAENGNTKNHLGACIKQSQNCTPFVASVDSLLGV